MNEEFNAPADDKKQYELERILEIEIPLSVVMAKKKVNLKEVLDMSTGQIIEFEKTINEPLEIYANNRIIAKGVTVKSGEKYALQLKEITTVEDTIRSLGADAIG